MAKTLIRLRRVPLAMGDDDDMLLDAGDVGCVYGTVSNTQRGTNKHRLQQAIADIAAASPNGGGIMISGPLVTISGVSTRVAGELHIDVNPASTQGELASNTQSRGPLVFPKDGSGNVIPFVLRGLLGSVLVGGGVTEAGNIPGHVIELSNTVGQASEDPENRNTYVIDRLNVKSASRGIWVKKAGHGCILREVHVNVTGILADTPFTAGPTWTEWHDWNSFQSRLNADSVPYGIRIDDADGIKLRDCSIKDCSTHGLIATRIHAGYIDLISSENKGVGMAVDRLRNTRLRLRAESNGSYALLANVMMNCEVDSWVEANRRWRTTTTVSFPGNKHRSHALMSGCQSNRLYGHATNRSNLWRMGEGTRLSNIFRDVEWIDPSRAATVDETDVTTNALNTAVSNANKNYATVWTNATFRPTMVLSGNDIVLTIPSGAFNLANLAASGTTSFLYPFADASLPSVGVGDIVAWSCDIDFDADAVAFCNASESNRSATLQQANPLFIKMLHANDPGTYKEIEQGHANIHLWNSGDSFALTRKFAGRKEIFAGVSTAFPTLSIGTWTSGLDDSGPSTDLTIKIRNLRMWHLPTNVT